MHNETENINGKDKHASQTVRLSVNYFTLKYQSIGKIDHLSVVGGARFPAGTYIFGTYLLYSTYMIKYIGRNQQRTMTLTNKRLSYGTDPKLLGYRYDNEISNIQLNVCGYFFVELMHAITEYNCFSQPQAYPQKGVNATP